ncbi:MAG: hypothetical protein JXR83_01090 [Deltaproteobacteria bacterium]|nr:hypothetical protein [Deltaproteobacteria bacterium]
MLARLFGRKGKPRGEQQALAGAMYRLDRRRTEIWIPYLKQRIDELKAAIAQKAGK